MLNKYDFEILNFIKISSPILENSVLEKFKNKKYNVNYRIKDYSRNGFINIKYKDNIGTIFITELGNIEIQNYKATNRINFISNVIIAIIVQFVVGFLLIYIQEKYF